MIPVTMPGFSSSSPSNDDKKKSKKEHRIEDDNDDVFLITLSPGDKEMAEKFNACTKNDFPKCLDEALRVIFAASKNDAVKDVVIERARKKNNSERITSPEGILHLYKSVIEEFRNELGEGEAKLIESEGLKKMQLMHCQKCPLYKIERSRFQKSNK